MIRKASIKPRRGNQPGPCIVVSIFFSIIPILYPYIIPLYNSYNIVVSVFLVHYSLAPSVLDAREGVEGDVRGLGSLFRLCRHLSYSPLNKPYTRA